MDITKIRFPRIDVASFLSGDTDNLATVDAQGKLKVTVNTSDFLTETQLSETEYHIAEDAENKLYVYGLQATIEAIDAKIASVYKPAGSVAFADLPTLAKSVLGNVYNLTEEFTTTADFVEGAGKKYPAGTNVVVVDVGTEESPSYKFDVLPGFIDLSGYQEKVVAGDGITLNVDGKTISISIAQLVDHIEVEDLTASVDGTATEFALSNTPVKVVDVEVDGVDTRVGAANDYSVDGSTIKFTEAIPSGSSLVVKYWKA